METQKSENYALEQIPDNAKRGWMSMFCVLVAIGVDLSSVILGAELANSMPIDKAILSVVVGSFLSAILYTLCSLVGSSTNLSTSMITKHVFGDIGAKIFSMAIGVSLLGWFGVQVGFFSENASILFNSFNMSIDIKIISLIGGLLMMSTVIYGYRAMEKLSVYSVPLLLSLMFLTIFLGFKTNGIPAIDSDIQQTMEFAQGVSLVVSIIIVGAIISPDISRWAKSRKDCALASFFGILFGNSFMIIVSIILVKCMGISEIMNIFLILGLALPGMLVLTLAQWTTNSSNIYSSSLSIALVLKNIPHKKLTIGLGLVGTALAVFGIYEGFIGFLNLLSIVVAPVGGVYVAEYYIVKAAFENIKEYKETEQVVVRSIIAWIIGIVVTALSTYGFITLTTIAPLDGFIVGFIGQVIISKILNK